MWPTSVVTDFGLSGLVCGFARLVPPPPPPPLFLAFAAVLVACGGEFQSADERATSDAAGDAPDCGIHQVIEYPTYFGDADADVFDVPVGDAGLFEVCTRVEGGAAFYLCAPPV